LPSPVAGVVTSLGGEVGDVLAVGSALIRIETTADVNGEVHARPAPRAHGADRTRRAAAGARRSAAAPGARIERPRPSRRQQRRVGRAGGASTRHLAGHRSRNRHWYRSGGSRGCTATLDTHLQQQTTTATPRRISPPIEVSDDSVDEVKVVGLRRNIAQRMDLAKTRIPHFTYVEEVDVTDLERLRAYLNQERLDGESRLTLLPFLMRATVVSVVDFPQMNARYDDDNGVVNRHRAVHLGIATQTAKGLMVPVVKHAEGRDLWGYADEVARLSIIARNGSITVEELTGSTITISSPRRAGRDRRDSDHQLPRGRDHRGEQGGDTAGVHRRHVVPASDHEPVVVVRPSSGRRRRRRGVHPTDQSTARDTRSNVHALTQGACHAGGSMSVPAPTLTGRHVQLEQLRIEFAEELTAAGNEERSSYGWTPVPPTVDGMQRYIAGLLDDQEARTVVPFVQRSDQRRRTRRLHALPYVSSGGVAGDLPGEVEIGGTWLAASAQRTAINTEAKYLLLRNAFDDWDVHRVAICTDSRNTQSRTAILRIGAAFEGILRSHRGSYAPGEENIVARDSAMYSVVRADWPEVKRLLEARLA
jgi:2-oxoisovalerate dehydrogenase E2 component (dihydrolipoyl transacylase)